MAEEQAQQPQQEMPRIIMIFRGLTIGTMKGKNGKMKDGAVQRWFLLEGVKGGTSVTPSWLSQIEDFDKNPHKYRDRSVLYSPKNMPNPQPGAIYTFEQPEPQHIRPGTARFVELIRDDNDVISRWHVELMAFKAEENAKRQEKSELLTDLPWEALAPFREAYQRATSFQQSAILLKAIDYIRRFK
jgi:hypothetical protein